MYLEFLKKSFQQNLVYRGNTAMRIVLSFLYLFVTVSIWKALYQGRDTVSGVALQDMITYVIIAQLAGSLMSGGVSRYIAERVRTGAVAIDFARPVSLKYAAYFHSWGSSLFMSVAFGLPMLATGTATWGISLPAHGYQWVFFFLSIGLAVVLRSSIEYIMGLTAFWFKTDFHISWIMGALTTLFSGAVVPLWFYPPLLQSVAEALPFRFYMYEPVAIFLGKTPAAGCVRVALIQLAWILALDVLGRIVWRQARKVVVVQGG